MHNALYPLIYQRRYLMVVAYLYFLTFTYLAISFNFSLYTVIIWNMLLPACIFSWLLHRSFLTLLESLIFSIPAVFIIDYVGHASRSWNYWGNETLGIYIGPYPLVALLWGVSVWMAVTTFYSYFFDRGTVKRYLSKETYVAAGSLMLVGFFATYYDGQSIPYFYALFLMVSLVINICLLTYYRYPFLKTYIPVLYLVPIGLMNETIALFNGHWAFEVGPHIAYIPHLPFVFPLEELLWFFIAHHTIILIHETVACRQRF
jgi:hypothetical protein